MQTRVLGLSFLLSLLVLSNAEGRLCGSRYLEAHPERFALPRPKLLSPRRTTGKIEVGSQLDFLVAGDSRLRPATCRYVGEHCYIFVDDAEWDANGGRIFQKDVDYLGKLFDSSTPADLGKGMYELETNAFGDPPDVDGDERIFIFVLDVDDSSLIGFFDARVASWPDPALRRDTIYLSAYALANAPYLARGTLAHEFQHMIHWGRDQDEEVWIDEGLSGYAEALTGFPETDPTMVPRFLENPDLDLTAWPLDGNATIPHYGATYLFVSFLAEHYGTGLLRRIVGEPRNGIDGIDQAFAASGWVQDFEGAWGQWIVGNCAPDDEIYGYRALKGRRARVYPAPPLPFEEVQGVVNNQWGAVNVVFRSKSSISVDFSGEEFGRYRVYGYAVQSGESAVVQMAMENGYQGNLEIPDLDSLVLVVGRTSLQGKRFELSARTFVPTVVAGEREPLPQGPVLEPAFPNPFNSSLSIPFRLPAPASVELSIYDALGQRVRILCKGMREAGVWRTAWDSRDERGEPVGSGTYLAVLRMKGTRLVRKVSLIR